MLGICYFAWSKDMCAGCLVPLLQPVEKAALLFMCHYLFDQSAWDWYAAAAGYRAYVSLIAGNDGVSQSLGAQPVAAWQSVYRSLLAE
jgi:hypothetical protein